MRVMSEDALSSVVAIMLILAIIVTFISIYSSIYVPSLKEQAEIDHISEVEHAFLKFGSDIENAPLMKDKIILSEPVPLGGADILFNSVKSSGSLMVKQEDDPLVSVIRKTSDNQYLINKTQLVNYSYCPSFSFWEKQGYIWQYGYTNVTKNNLTTPLLYYDMEGVTDAAKKSNFANNLISFDSVRNITTGNCSSITITLVNFTAGKNNCVSGNGMGKLMLTGNDPVTSHSSPEELKIRVNKNLPLREFSKGINQKTYQELGDMCEAYDNIHVTKTMDFDTISVKIDQPVTPVDAVDVCVRVVGIEISVQ